MGYFLYCIIFSPTEMPETAIAIQMMQNSHVTSKLCRTVIQATAISLAVQGAVPGDLVPALLMKTQTAMGRQGRGGDLILNSLTMSLCSLGEASLYSLGKATQVVLKMNPAQLLAVLILTEIQREHLIMRGQVTSLSQRHPTMKDLNEAHMVDQMTVIRFQLQPAFYKLLCKYIWFDVDLWGDENVHLLYLKTVTANMQNYVLEKMF